ncbi:MAG TPA: ABC transporter substrate-binding protein [Acidimicrobiales bacterium]|nr:ABC transporter substrate-binding protein [Acidimicrobiales bacterium]
MSAGDPSPPEGNGFDRRSFLRLGAGAGAALAGVSGLAALAGNEPAFAASAPKHGGSLQVATEAEEDGFDPGLVTWDTSGVIYARTVYDSLAVLGANGSVQPYLAQSIKHNADYTSWTITVRPNITFHNGAPLNGAALYANAEHLVASPIVGPALSPIADIAVSGPYSITFTMKQPWVAFPYGLTGQAGMVAEPGSLKNGTAMRNPIGTGPFVFKEWVPGDHFTATRNPHYWRPGLPYLNSITYRPIPDIASRDDSLKSGTVSLLISSDVQSIVDFRGNSQYVITTDLHKVTGETDQIFLMLNAASPPLDDVRVRTALAYAISPKVINDTLGYGIAPLSTGPFTAGTPLYAPTGYPQYNPAKAKALLRQVAAEKGPISFAMGCTNVGRNLQTMELVQAELQSVGVKTTINQVLQSSYITNALFGKYQLYLWRQFGTPDPDSNFIFWSSTTTGAIGSESLNFARNKDSLIDAALTVGRENPNPRLRIKAYQQVARRFAADIPYLWLTRAVWTVVHAQNVTGLLNPTVPGGTPALPIISGVFFPSNLSLT